MPKKKRKILAIIGPTAIGKTDIAIFLAKKFNGELVACDSRQVYMGLDIGTGKMPSLSSLRGAKRRGNHIKKKDGYWVIDGVKIWMYDVADPTLRYNVAQYTNDANKVITNIFEKRKLPIIVGGTGLYFKALIYGLSNLSVPTNPKLKSVLEQLTLEQLQKKLFKADREKWENINNSERHNKRRLVRFIELAEMRSHKIDSRVDDFCGNDWRESGSKVLKIGLTVPRVLLNQRIDARVLSRIDQGMIEEAERLYENGLSLIRMRELGLEYGILADYLERKINESTHDLTVGVSSLDRTSSVIGKPSTLQSGFYRDKKDLIEIMQIKIHQYAKRQMTWFKKEKDVFWFDISEKGWQVKVEKLVLDWYNS